MHFTADQGLIESPLASQEWFKSLSIQLKPVLGRAIEANEPRLLDFHPHKTPDSPAKYLIRNGPGNVDTVLYISPLTAPEIVRRHIDGAASARRMLGETLGRVVLQPLSSGKVGGLSYALMPYCQTLKGGVFRGWLQRSQIQSPLMEWLRQANAQTVHTMGASRSAREEAIRSLECLRTSEILAPRFLPRIDRALGRLHDGTWEPRWVLMHGDLWHGNVLILPRGVQGQDDPRWWHRLVLIDWPGSRSDGFPFYDLIRLSLSLGTGLRRIRNELRAHANLVQCEPSDAWGYMGSALGSIALRPEHFPIELFRWIAHECMTCLEATGV